jgi:RNA polymerase sigma-70 factor (ECF subfamily)
VVDELDPEMIRAAAAGDLVAFEKIVRAYQQNIWRFLRRFLGDAAAAEDVAQEVFLRLYRSLPSFAHQAKFSAWVFKIARNAALDELRRQKRRERLMVAAATVAVTDGATGSDGTTGEARVEIEAALAALPDDLRETVVLVEVFGLPYAEVSDVVGVPVGTIKSRMFRARERMQDWARCAEEAAGEL